MEDYWSFIDYPPMFTGIHWNDDVSTSDMKGFQRRRSSSVDLLYLKFNHNEIIHEEEASKTLEFPAAATTNDDFNFSLTTALDDISTCCSSSPPPPKPAAVESFKRRRSSSLPPVFKRLQTPIIFTPVQVADPTPAHHVQKVPKIDPKPIPIERVIKKKPYIKQPDPAEKQKQLDLDLLNLNFDDVTVAELKDMLKKRGLPTTGKKAVLAERLKLARDQIQQEGQALLADDFNMDDLLNFELTVDDI